MRGRLRSSPIVRAALVVGPVLAVLVLLLVFVPKLQTRVFLHAHMSQADKTELFNAEDRARQTLATIIAGVLLLVGAYFTWRNTRAAEKNAEVAVKNSQLSEANSLS